MITNHIIESFLKCSYKAYLLFNNKLGNPSEYEELKSELLSMYRTDFYDRLQAKYEESQLLRGVWFKKKLAITDTTYVLEPIYQAEDIQIRFDAIEITPHRDLPLKLLYLPMEVIPKEKVSKTDKLALAVKCLLLTQAQRRVTPEFGKIVYGRALNSTKVKLAVYAKEARKVLKDLTTTLQSNDPPRFFLNNDCRTCQFEETCKATLVEKDDLSLLARMNPRDVLKQNNQGIFTVLQFSYTFRPRRRSKKAPNKALRFEPALKALALREKKTYVQELPKLPQTDVEVYLDFEGLPDENFIYLIGLIIKQSATEQQFSFWADTKEDEENIFAQLFETLASFDKFTVYHYGSHETLAINRLNRKFNNRYEKEVTWMLEKSVNILTFFSSKIYPPTYTNELKDIARFLGFRWSEQDASGIQSIVWRKRWELSQDAEYKSKLIQYNIEDCQALRITKEWLTRIGERFSDENDQSFTKVDDIKIQGRHKYCYTDYLLQEFDDVNKFAYFKYQREKIYLKTNTQLKKLVRRKQKQLKKVNKPNKIVDVPFPEECPYCRSTNRLTRLKQEKKTIIDLKFTSDGVKKWIVLFKGIRFWCRTCNKHFTPSNIKNLPKFGRNLIIWSINLQMAHKVHQEKVSDILLESFNIKVSDGAMYMFKAKLCQEYKDTLTEIKQHLIEGPLIHTDETKASIKGVEKYVWVFTDIDSVHYLFRQIRETEFLKEWLQGFKGVLVSDFYTGYDSLPCAQQKCLVHLIRDLNDDLFKNQLNSEFKEIVTHFGKLLKTIMETVNTYGLKKRHLQKHQKDVDRFYRRIINNDYESELAISYQKRFKKYREKLFTFLHYDGIPWNNNNAETAIKYFATYRRNVGGNFTEKSIQDALMLLSIQQTCKYRGLSFLEFLKSGEKSIEAYTKKVLG